MKQAKHKMLVSTLTAALTLGGTFTGIVHSAFADETAPAAQSGGTADSGSAAAATTAAPTASPNSDGAAIDGVSIPVFAKVHGVDLRLGKAALSTALIVGDDLQDVYDSLSQGSTLLQIGTLGTSDYQGQLIAMTQSNIDAAETNGNLTSQQANALSRYATGVLDSEINDPSYRDNDNSSGDNVTSALLSVDADSAVIAQFLGMTQDDLTAALQSGKSIGAIAADKGISDDKLVAQLESGLAPDLKQIIWGSGQSIAASAPVSAPADTSDDDTSSN